MKALAREIMEYCDGMYQTDHFAVLKSMGVTRQQLNDWGDGKHVARESTAKKIRAKLAKLNRIEQSPGFTSSKVSEDEGNEKTVDLIRIIVDSQEESSHKLEAISHILLSK